MVLVSLYLLIAPIVDDPRLEFLYAALFVLGGLIVYLPLVHFKVQVKGFGTYAPRTWQVQYYGTCHSCTSKCKSKAMVRRHQERGKSSTTVRAHWQQCKSNTMI